MQYTCEITVDVSRDRFIELFDDVENLKHWMKGLVSFEHLTGEPGQPGSTSRLEFLNNGRSMVMTETVIVRNLPHEFGGTYEMKGVLNSVFNRFEAVAPNRTRWVMESDFKLGGFLKVLGFLMPWMFRMQSQQHMKAFKAFAESRAAA